MPLYDQYRAGIYAFIAALGESQTGRADSLVFQHRFADVLDAIERIAGNNRTPV